MVKPTDDGSVPLGDVKRERFAMALAEPMDVLDAYAKAGYAPDRKNAKRMAERADVRARVRFLMAPAFRSAAISRERVVKEIAALAFSDIRDVVIWGNIARETGEETADGIPIVAHFNDVAFVNSDQLSDEAAAAVAEVKRSADGAISIKMHPKTPSLKMLAEILRMMAPVDPNAGQAANRGLPNLADLTPEEAVDELEKAFRNARIIEGTATENAG